MFIPFFTNSHEHTFYFKHKFLPKAIGLILFSIVLSGCDLTGSQDEITTFETDFNDGEDNWEPFFTDYPASYEESMEFDYGLEPLPEPLNSSASGYFITATNRSDDVKMLFRKQVSGLEPNTTYRTRFTVRFATDEPSGCAGVGGAPGESVKVIAAASQVRPEPVTDENENDPYIQLNIQQLNDPQAWYQNAIMGDISNSRECEDEHQYEIKEVNSEHNHSTVTTDESGRAWLLFGTRSGFEGTTTLYYTYISAELVR